MILDPINAVTSVAFYRRIARQPASRTVLYLCYIGVLFALTAAAAARIRLLPALHEAIEWFAVNTPVITFADGKVTADPPGPTVLRHPSAPDFGVVIDSARTEPVTPQLMEEQRARLYLAGNALYTRKNSSLEVHDFSRATPSGKPPFTLDAEGWRKAKPVVSSVVYSAMLLIVPFAFLLWKLLAALVYSLFAMLLGSASGSSLEFPAFFNIAAYAQTLVTVLQAILLVIPATIPKFSLAALLITGVYLWLGIKAAGEPEPQPE